ncbi:MAG: hypothetical protein MUO27_00245 [Sedimentisphaerales bacterium]|nr:hypothetical protein [Sedimentisphaerales bacterium]
MVLDSRGIPNFVVMVKAKTSMGRRNMPQVSPFITHKFLWFKHLSNIGREYGHRHIGCGACTGGRHYFLAIANSITAGLKKINSK